MQNYRVHHHQAQVGGSGESRGGSDQNRQRLREENEKSVLKANSTVYPLKIRCSINLIIEI